MQDDMEIVSQKTQRIDARILRHMMHETIDLLDLSTDHADEACTNTDAAMTLTRVDWMLMAIFNWLSERMKDDNRKPLGEPVSIVGIDQSVVSSRLRKYAQAVDRLHTRIRQLDILISENNEVTQAPLAPRTSGQVLHIFGDPVPGQDISNPVISSHQRLKSAFGSA